MNTESRRQMPYASKHDEPIRLNHQKELGTTTCLRFSVTYHCTKKREKKIILPAQPTIFQKCQSIPRIRVLLVICASISMRSIKPNSRRGHKRSHQRFSLACQQVSSYKPRCAH